MPQTSSTADIDAPDYWTHARVMEVMSGLMLGTFVGILSSTVVANALPTIMADLHGTETDYTWMISAQLIAMAASTPLWGKLADLYSKKLLVQVALIIFVFASAAAGFAEHAEWLIGCRVFQGIGAGGLTALTQVVLASIVAPRDRGRYNGYLGAVFALATLGGPLIGGTIVDTSWLGWRWCFYVGIPFAVVTLIILQRKLILPASTGTRQRLDWAGASTITAAVCVLLLWISLAGKSFAWGSWQTALMLVGAAALAALAYVIERRAADPVIPPELFGWRTVCLAALASLFVGVGMYGATVFLGQYFQLARGDSPMRAGLATLPMVLGLFISSMVVGQIISRTGLWKRYLVAGSFLITLGMLLMGSVRVHTSYPLLAVYMFILGCGVGMTMQNLVLAVQNTIPARDLGSGSSLVVFVRTIGGAIGVSGLGAVLANKVTTYTAEDFAHAGIPLPPSHLSGAIPDIHTLPAVVRPLIGDAYGHAVGDVFLLASITGLPALITVCLIHETPLRRRAAEG